MIGIKKVQVTPLDRNYASVVDSTSTLDDKTKNTYSMRVIDDGLNNKANSNDVYTKGNFAIITGTFAEGTNDYEATANLPTGFTATNSIIISAMAHNPSNSTNQWGTGTVFTSASYVGGGVPIMARIDDNGLLVRMRNIQFTTEGSTETAYVSKGSAYEFKVVLMKIS